MAKHIDFARHFLVPFFQLRHEVDRCRLSASNSKPHEKRQRTLAQYFPLAGLHPSVCRQLVPQLVE
jgi:hypothetical protein